MNFFDYLRKPGSSSAKPQPLQIRREVILTEAAPVRKQLTPALPRSKGRKIPPGGSVEGQVPLRLSTSTARGSSSRKRPTPEQALESSSDDSDSEEAIGVSYKKSKSNPTWGSDQKRQIRSLQACSREDGGVYPMVHAADIASLDTSIRYLPLFEGLKDMAEVLLQYPSTFPQERYYLVKPQHGPDDFKPIKDIVEAMHTITKHYLPQAERHLFDNESTGYPQRLIRAVKRQSEKEVRITIGEWNDALVRLRDNGTITEVLDSSSHLDSELVECILTQTYFRTVSPRVNSLREYENGTDNVYGELLPNFISEILHKDTQLKSDQVFIDLGSGVGNVVLQIALEIGCESWGCEMMKNACDLAELQREEFKARCRLWGLAVGDIHLERGDFLTNTVIGKTLKRADVVLVNNQAFTPELNEGLIRMFLDLKEGCRIVSLKSFVPAAHKITARNLNSPYNILQVEKKEYYSRCVSWTDAAGTYYVSTKDTRKIKAFAAKNQ